jgi:hypothetical protein
LDFKQLKKKVGVVPLAKLGDIEFKNVTTKIGVQTSRELELAFFI